jgi:lantibiotic modifying enzyme
MKQPYLEVADRICGRLCRDALWSRGLCCWTADRSGGSGGWHGALVPHLYSGTAGIALALWRVAAATGDSTCRFTAKGAIARSLAMLPVRQNGYYAGCLGIRHAAAEILGELDEAAILREAEPNPETLDIIGGSAGAIAVLLDFARRTGRCAYLEMAVRHGDLLIAEAIREGGAWAWQTIAEHPPVTGFSHGTAGIGWALLELWQATGEARFRDAAQGAFEYERACFHPGGGWPDLRGDAPVFQSVWCHGAGGIAYSRLRAWQILGDGDCLDEARIGLEIVRAGLSGLQNFSLCHGSAGNGDLMIYAAEVLGEAEWMESAERVGEDGMERYARPRAPWPSGLLRASETPDLMWGTAGIAYFYLRLAGFGAPTMLLPCAGG